MEQVQSLFNAQPCAETGAGAEQNSTSSEEEGIPTDIDNNGANTGETAPTEEGNAPVIERSANSEGAEGSARREAGPSTRAGEASSEPCAPTVPAGKGVFYVRALCPPLPPPPAPRPCASCSSRPPPPIPLASRAPLFHCYPFRFAFACGRSNISRGSAN